MKDLIISKLREMVKVKKPKVKKTEPTEADRSDFAAWQDKKERDREPSDIEDERNQMAKHYGQQSEAIDFSKKTILGKAARPMAAQMLKKRKAELQKEPALANKGGAVAKELKVFSKDTYRHRGDPKPEPQRSSTDLRTQLMYILADKLDEVNKPRLNVPDPTDRPKPEPVPTEPVKPPKPLAKYYKPKSKKPPITEELKAKIAYILANKIDEIINPSFKVDKEEVEARKTRGMKPFPTTNKPTPNRAELMRDAAKAAAEAAKKPMPKITDVDVSQYLPKPKPSPESLIVPHKSNLFMGKKPPVKEWTERIIKILVEMKRPAHLQADKYKISGAAKLQGLPYINKLRADRGQRPHPRSPLANDPKIDPKSKALASVFNKQPLGPGEEAKVKADKAKEAADRPRVEAALAKFDRDPVVSRIRRNNRRWNR